MAVRDHGLEAIRKSTEQVTPGDDSEYRLRIAGEANVNIRADISGVTTVVALNSTTWTALPASNLALRKALQISNNSGIEIELKLNSNSGSYGTGRKLKDQEIAAYDIGPSITMYARAASGTPSVVVEELS
jgi:hypothetical protein